MLLLPDYIQILIVAAAGLVFGSFATALTWRETHGKPWCGRERSRCPHCQAVLGMRDLVPLFSWLLLRGRCRHCRAPIGIVYPLIELASMIMALAFWATWGHATAQGGLDNLLFLIPAVPFLLALLIVDARLMILPDRLMMCLGVIFLLFAAYQSYVTAAGIAGFGMVVATGFAYALLLWGLGLIMKFLLKKEALGFGDVKFFLVAGWGLGAAWLPTYLILSGICGIVTGLFWRIGFKSPLFPFGPAIIIAFFICLLCKGAGIIPPPAAY